MSAVLALELLVGFGCSPYCLRRVLGLLPNGAHNGFGLLAGGFRCRCGGGRQGFREFALHREHFLGKVEDLLDHLLRIHPWCCGPGGSGPGTFAVSVHVRKACTTASCALRKV